MDLTDLTVYHEKSTSVFSDIVRLGEIVVMIQRSGERHVDTEQLRQ